MCVCDSEMDVGFSQRSRCNMLDVPFPLFLLPWFCFHLFPYVPTYKIHTLPFLILFPYCFVIGICLLMMFLYVFNLFHPFPYVSDWFRFPWLFPCLKHVSNDFPHVSLRVPSCLPCLSVIFPHLCYEKYSVRFRQRSPWKIFRPLCLRMGRWHPTMRRRQCRGLQRL